MLATWGPILLFAARFFPRSCSQESEYLLARRSEEVLHDNQNHPGDLAEDRQDESAGRPRLDRKQPGTHQDKDDVDHNRLCRQSHHQPPCIEGTHLSVLQALTMVRIWWLRSAIARSLP